MNRTRTLLSALSLASLTLFLPAHARAQGQGVLAAGQTFDTHQLADQHGEPVVLGEDVDLVLMSFEMSLSKSIHGYLEDKDPGFLASHRTHYVTDITKMPAIITFLFAGPKMRRYPFPIILTDDPEFGPGFPQEEGKITVIELTPEREVKAVGFYDGMPAIEQAYFAAEEAADETDEAAPADQADETNETNEADNEAGQAATEPATP